VDEDTEEVNTYQIVGSDEADVKKGFLSITSPLAKALIGKTMDDEIEVSTPNGSKVYTIQEVRFV
jgi:transcription elongation factor GreA